MVTRRGFIAKASAACAALVGLALSQRYDQPSASGQAIPPAPPVIKPQPAGDGEQHRVEAKIESVQPQPWTVRTFRYVASKRTALNTHTGYDDARLRARGLRPIGEPMPPEIRFTLPKQMFMQPNDTISFRLKSPSLNIIRNRFTPDVWDSPFDGDEIAFWMSSE